MALDLMGREIVDASAPANLQTALQTYSRTDRAPVVVANMTAANTLANQLETDGFLQAFPLFCWVQSEQRHMCKPSPTDGWVIVGGRLHGAHARVDRTVANSTVTELHVNTQGFLRQSVGFTRGPRGGVMIPEDGLYRVRVGGGVDGLMSATPGRRFVALKVNTMDLGGHVEFEGDTHFKLFDEWPFSQGDEIMPVAYHATGGNRIFSATIGVYQSLNPSW